MLKIPQLKATMFLTGEVDILSLLNGWSKGKVVIQLRR